MANPDTDDGWLKYAHELDAALAAADFSKGARIVLREVFAQIFGPAKRKTAELSPTDIARRIGRSKGYVGDSIAELIESRVLVRAGSRYAFRKDYEAWVRVVRPRMGGPVVTVPRLTGKEVEWCQGAPDHALSFAPPSESRRRTAPEPINGSTEVGSVVAEREGEGRSATAERSVPQRQNETFRNGRTKRSATAERPLPESLPENIAATSDAATSGGRPLTRERAPASEETRETRETTQSSRIVCETGVETHTSGPETPGSTPQRSEDDYADVRMAASILVGDLRTTHLGTELLRQHNLPGLIVLEGWRWVLAANAILGAGIEDRKRRSFPYLVGIARGYAPADRERAAAPAPAVNGHAPAAARPESPAERKRRELKEGFARLKAELATEGDGDAS